MSAEGQQQFCDNVDMPFDPERQALDAGELCAEFSYAQSTQNRQFRSWVKIGLWNPTVESEQHIKLDSLLIAKEGQYKHIKHLISHFSRYF